MYKQSASKNRRPRRSSRNKHVKHTSNRGNSDRSGSSYKGNYRSKRRGSGGGSNWKGKNRRRVYTRIDPSLYVSEASSSEAVASYSPQTSFNTLDLHKTLKKNISDRNYVTPTKIQDQAIPEILKSRDILGIGKTGSGKTGAFLIPMIDKVLKNRDNNKVLIITPTRELASQINKEFRKFAKDTGLRMVLVIGGANIREQIRQIRNRPNFVVATPGRLMDLDERNVVKLRSFNNIVLDEVDRMLDMGFVNDIKRIISRLAPTKQTLFFSATVSRKEEDLANTLLTEPIKVESDTQAPHKSVHQDIVKVDSKAQKIQVLHNLLKQHEFHKVLVFSGTKRYADKISYELRDRGFKADSLHGGKTQNKRTRVLDKFRGDRIDVLVATDVAARGIDIPNISHVINFDEPATYNDYIHRIGRTGRIGNKGKALTFVVSKSRNKKY